jgi:Rieske Fe-S protein
LKQNKTNRRYFIKSVALGLLLAMGFLWDKLVKTENSLSAGKKATVPFNPNKRVSFQGDFIVLNQDGHTRVFSSHCTHLGCRINETEGDRLVCPCHGSAFDMEGNAVQGPAVRPLQSLAFSIDKGTNQITIEV